MENLDLYDFEKEYFDDIDFDENDFNSEFDTIESDDFEILDI